MSGIREELPSSPGQLSEPVDEREPSNQTEVSAQTLNLQSLLWKSGDL
jgi:hypothetical protein